MTFRLNRSLVLLFVPVVGCALFGVEPDEIDVANGSESEDGAEEGGGTGELDSVGDPDTGVDDGTSGDTGDEDPGGDGDPGDAGDGDGDGDAAETLCEELGAQPLVLGPNDATIAPGASVIESSCGHPGPERVYSYTSEEAVDLELTLSSDYDAALYDVDGLVCLPLVELSCVNTPESLLIAVEAGQIIHVVVDAAPADGGTGTLDVAIVP